MFRDAVLRPFVKPKRKSPPHPLCDLDYDDVGRKLFVYSSLEACFEFWHTLFFIPGLTTVYACDNRHHRIPYQIKDIYVCHETLTLKFIMTSGQVFRSYFWGDRPLLKSPSILWNGGGTPPRNEENTEYLNLEVLYECILEEEGCRRKQVFVVSCLAATSSFSQHELAAFEELTRQIFKFLYL